MSTLRLLLTLTLLAACGGTPGRPVGVPPPEYEEPKVEPWTPPAAPQAAPPEPPPEAAQPAPGTIGPPAAPAENGGTSGATLPAGTP